MIFRTRTDLAKLQLGSSETKGWGGAGIFFWLLAMQRMEEILSDPFHFSSAVFDGIEIFVVQKCLYH